MTTTNDANTAKVNNGVNVAALLGAREALEQTPRLLSSNGAWRANGSTERTAVR